VSVPMLSFVYLVCSGW